MENETEVDGYVVVDDDIYMRLSEMGKHGTSKRKKEAAKVKE